MEMRICKTENIREMLACKTAVNEVLSGCINRLSPTIPYIYDEIIGRGLEKRDS